MEQMPEQQARGTRADDADLGSLANHRGSVMRASQMMASVARAVYNSRGFVK